MTARARASRTTQNAARASGGAKKVTIAGPGAEAWFGKLRKSVEHEPVAVERVLGAGAGYARMNAAVLSDLARAVDPRGKLGVESTRLRDGSPVELGDQVELALLVDAGRGDKTINERIVFIHVHMLL